MFNVKHLRFIAILICILGLGSAIFIYLTAEPAPGSPFGYDPFTSKKYIRDLELYGGKFNVLAAEFSRWLGGIWHGKSLAFTVGFISLAMAFLVWFISTPPQIRKSPPSKTE